jgi:hypothetical protein
MHFTQQQRTSVHLLCWTCRTHITRAPITPATATDNSPSVKLSIFFFAKEKLRDAG